MAQQRDQERDQDRADDGKTPLDAAVRHLHFGVLDAFRRMQGEMLASLGFGPLERPYRVIAAGPYWRLRDYGPEDRFASVLIVAAPIKRPYIWDLTPAVSAIGRCLEAGLRVHLLEWLPASADTCGVGLAECAQAIAASLAAIGSGAEAAKPVLMGHSLGGMLAAIHAAMEPRTIAGLVLLGTPLCFGADNSLFRDALVTLVPEHILDTEPYPGSMLSQISALASPHAFVWSRLMDATLSAADRGAMDIHARIERWALDEVALPGKLVSEVVGLLYRENRYCRGILQVGERTVGPEGLSAPALAVVNAADAVAPLGSVSPIREVLGPERFLIIDYPGETGVGLQHLGVLVGRRAHAQVWPQIVDWIQARSSPAEPGCGPEASDPPGA